MSWPMVSLGELVEVFSGFAFKSDRFNASGEGLPLVRIRDVKGGESETYYSGEFTERFVVSDGDLLVGMDGEFNCAPWRGGRALLNQRVCRVTATDHRMDQDYLRRFLPAALKVIEARTSFVTVKHLSSKDIAAIQIPLPPLLEQRRIAAILDQADALRRLRRQSLSRLSDFGQVIFFEMFGDPIQNPRNWLVGSVRDLVSEAKYGTAQKANTTGEGIPILRMGNLTYEGRIDLTDLKHVELAERDIPKYTTRRGDLLFNRTNSKELVGKTAVVDSDEPMAIAGYLVRVRTNERGNPHYISAFLNSRPGKAILQNMCKNIVGMANINAQELQDIAIPIPPVTLQEEFAKKLGMINQRRALYEKAIGESEALFASLQHRAFRGEL
ncbi:restriction endonuclease subunit S [Sphingomonas parapaucimobilis]|uniref:restriction endonuclease subunit S n=1 Tax=Sphingomonas parapaucimobilis TaxID=28213 RepID=UPI00321BDA73